ncbi:MAG: hypothetical protein KAH33_06300, partial [Candidatus Delongbacteria bacterium]|nr:hypothetical protein [Candidatus Delongbacteria bacterium]
MKRTLSTLFFLALFSFLFSQEEIPTEVTQDSVATATADSSVVITEPVKELTEEEKLCKETADGFMSFYEQWDTSRDYNILMPRIKKYVENFYKNDPAKSNKKNYTVLEENYRKIMQLDAIVDLKPILLKEQERVNNEITGKLGNVALFGYIPRGAEDKIKIILEKLLIISNENKTVLPYYTALKDAYKNINRINIEYHDLINKTYAEVTRVTDKRLNFLYIDDEVDELLANNSEILAVYVKSQTEKFKASMAENIKEKYALKKKAEEEGNEDKINQYHDEWLAAKGRTIDNVYSGEISRLLGIVNSFLKSPGSYDIKDEFILKVRDNTSDLEAYFSNILKIKFYNDLVSKSKKYFRFEVEKGFRGYRANVMIFTFLFFILFFYVFLTVKKKKDTIFIRRIPG